MLKLIQYEGTPYSKLSFKNIQLLLKYFMVFEHKKMDGAYKLDEFLNMFKNM